MLAAVQNVPAVLHMHGSKAACQAVSSPLHLLAALLHEVQPVLRALHQVLVPANKHVRRFRQREACADRPVVDLALHSRLSCELARTDSPPL